MANTEKMSIPNLFAEEDAKRVVSATPSWKNTLGFLAELTFPIDAVENLSSAESNNWIPPVKRRGNIDAYIREFEIVSRYVGQNEKMDEVGQKFDISRERVRQVLRKTLKSLHTNAPTQIREKYSFESLSTDSRSTIEARMRRSTILGGKSARVAELLSSGKNIEDIRAELGRISGTRQTLESWGINLPPLQEPNLVVFRELNNEDLDDETVQIELHKVNNNRQYEVLRKAGLVVDLSSVAKQAGLHISPRDVKRIHEVLDEEKMPMGKASSYTIDENGQRKVWGWANFIASIHIEKALAILKTNYEIADLRINPVKLVGGPDNGKIPNTTVLSARKDYLSVGALINDVKGKVRNNYIRIKMSQIIAGSPIQVYRWNNSYFYSKEQREQFASFLATRLTELGI